MGAASLAGIGSLKVTQAAAQQQEDGHQCAPGFHYALLVQPFDPMIDAYSPRTRFM